MYKIYLSPSTQQANIGNGNYGSEEMRMNEIANVTMSELYKTNQFTVYHNRPDMTLDEVVADSDSKKPDAHVAMHSNAQDGKHRGVLGLHWSKGGTTSASYKLTKAVHDKVLKVTGIDNGIRAGTGLAETDRVHATSTIVECGFHDNPLDAEFIETHIKELGIAYAEGICLNFGVQYIPEVVPVPEPVSIQLYKVRKSWTDIKSQIGAYADLTNAKISVEANIGYIAYDWNGVQVYPVLIPPTPTPIIEQIYRVRKTWDDTKSQVGAYKDLVNAKECADLNIGYKVFNIDGNIVYTSIAIPVIPIPTPEPVSVVIIPEPIPIKKVAIMGNNQATVGQMVKFLKDHNAQPKIGVTVEEFCQLFLDESIIEGIRGDIAFCQSIHETGWFNFGGQVLREQFNYAGIGATNNSATGKGAWFKDEREGIKAQIQHLKAYASTEELKQVCVDPRFTLVTKGIALNWTDLNGRWAVPGTTYGETILALYDLLYLIVEPVVTNNSRFKDFDKVAEYAKIAVLKAGEKNIFVGNAEGNFSPTDPISRQDFAVVLDGLGLLG